MLLSPRPNTRMLRDTMQPPASLYRYGIAHSFHIGLHSRGGPGSMRTCLPSASNAQPGAVPHRLVNTVQPSGSHACFSLFLVISRPMVLKKSVRRSMDG